MFKNKKTAIFLPRKAKILFITVTLLSVAVFCIQWGSAILRGSGQDTSYMNEYSLYALLTLLLPILTIIISLVATRHDQGRINVLTIAAFYVQIVTILQAPLTTILTTAPLHMSFGVSWPFIILPNTILIISVVIALSLNRKSKADLNQLHRSLIYLVYISAALSILVSYTQQLTYILNYKSDYAFIWYDFGLLIIVLSIAAITYKSLNYVKNKKDRIAKTLFYPALMLITVSALVYTTSQLVLFIPSINTTLMENSLYGISGSGLIAYLVILYINKKRKIL